MAWTWLLLWTQLLAVVDSFALMPRPIVPFSNNFQRKSSPSSLYLFGWNDNEEKDRKKAAESWLSNIPDPGQGSTSTAAMMENFKKSQQVGKRTAALMEELASTTITGAFLYIVYTAKSKI